VIACCIESRPVKDLDTAKKACEGRGSTLLAYEPGMSASLVLQSGETLLISIGPATAKIFIPRRIFGLGSIFPKIGWYFPQTFASQQLTIWEPKFF
jgi:hypothetical protein